MTLTKDRATELRALYRKWTIWQSDLGRWWAIREGAISPAQSACGVVGSLDADDLAGLADQLAEQEQIREATA